MDNYSNYTSVCPQGEIGDPGLRGEEGSPGRHVRLYMNNWLVYTCHDAYYRHRVILVFLEMLVYLEKLEVL